MNPTLWLESFAPGFSNLSDQERKAIANFALLWSLFEGSVLNANSSAKLLVATARRLAAKPSFAPTSFDGARQHFARRYHDGANTTPEFASLYISRSYPGPLVNDLIAGRLTADADILAALFIIVFRLRNNLFHGEKWSYEIKGQLANFQNANDVLMEAMTLHGSTG